MQELLAFVQAVGAPTAIAVLIIVRIEKRLDRLTEAVLLLSSRWASWQSQQTSGAQASTPQISKQSSATSP